MAVYQKLLTNEETGEVALIKSNDLYTLQSKINKKVESWNLQKERLQKQLAEEEAIKQAKKQTEEATQEIQSYKEILKYTLSTDDKIDWESLKDVKEFKKYSPNKKPELSDFEVSIPGKGLWKKIPMLGKSIDAKELRAKEDFEKASKDYDKSEKKRLEEYDKEKKEFTKNQTEYNSKLETMKTDYEKGEISGVDSYFALVLERSNYPKSLELFPGVTYDKNTKLLLVDMQLPHPTKLPNILEYKYVKSSGETTIKYMSKKESEVFCDEVLYQVALRTVHEVFESDYNSSVDTVVFNGWIEGTDPKTGQGFKNCVVSLQTNRDDFLQIKLENIDPKECFRHLKGVSAGSLINIAPVRPIMRVSTEDDRFIEASSVVDNFDETTNLASMEWQDFEVLIRDLFQKEFAREGCKVEVTRASHDQGVDGIAFDEDPIRGGKYVLQAKRYNNLVPVSAVRDLYGTVLNEGAVKGILITTSYYGKEALEFAKNKPLKLINGEELLYMFNSHGYKFKIEIAEKQKKYSSAAY